MSFSSSRRIPGDGGLAVAGKKTRSQYSAQENRGELSAGAQVTAIR
jgi:hypothetical protein